MVRTKSAAALAAGLFLALGAGAATPAGAALYAFDVTLQGASYCTLSTCGDIAGFAPFSFRQVWDIDAGADGFSLNQITNSYVASGSGAITPGAADASLLSLLGLGPAAPGQTLVESPFAGSYPGDPVYEDKYAWLSASGANPLSLVDGQRIESGFALWMYSAAGAPPSGLTEAGLAAALEGGGPLTYLASAYLLSSNARTYATTSYGQIDFFGEATYHPLVQEASPPEVPEVSAPVPEPSAWLLLIAGFGLTGAALRAHAGAAKRLQPALIPRHCANQASRNRHVAGRPAS